MEKQEIETFQMTPDRTRERILFLRRWLGNPLRTGAIFPSASGLAELVAKNIPDPCDGYVIELGAGTGAVSEGIARRVPQEKMVLVEIDEELCQWVRERLPRATVVQGDAMALDRLLPQGVEPGSVAVIVSGVPVVQFPLQDQREFLDQCFDLMQPGGAILQYSFSPVPPLPCRRLGLKAQRLGVAFANLPPLFLWRFTADEGHTAT